ncbi:peptidase inhibitor 16-like [Physella acuta]|uniref:peptidase inhibitor 16-like n=1 Tax=Physella acuta TaxID=109671 RepID=UPI0027DCE55B|nr:peptidase inhibitor 16-like [Physella acuta]
MLSNRPEVKEVAGRHKRSVYSSVSGLTDEERFRLVKKHNSLRSLEAASDMMLLKWSKDLEKSAQSHANLCILQPSTRRDVGPADEHLGENVYAVPHSLDLEEFVQTLYEERSHFNFKNVSCLGSGECGHYTQIVWSSSKYLGCGVKYCPHLLGDQHSPSGYLVVCHYRPRGNYIGVEPFKRGPVCSSCPKETKYCVRGLCAYRPVIGSMSPKYHMSCQFYGVDIFWWIVVLRLMINKFYVIYN